MRSPQVFFLEASGIYFSPKYFWSLLVESVNTEPVEREGQLYSYIYLEILIKHTSLYFCRDVSFACGPLT